MSRRVVAGIVLSVIGILGVAAATPLIPSRRNVSPDTAFVAVAHVATIYQVLPMMPGQGGDKPGTITVYRDGRSCGTADLPMVSMVAELRWDLDHAPREAWLIGGASWNLDRCRMTDLAG